MKLNSVVQERVDIRVAISFQHFLARYTRPLLIWRGYESITLRPFQLHKSTVLLYDLLVEHYQVTMTESLPTCLISTVVERPEWLVSASRDWYGMSSRPKTKELLHETMTPAHRLCWEMLDAG